MAKVLNLRAARKAKNRDAARKQGDANAVKFGRTKADKDLAAAQAEKAAHDLDGHQRT